MVPLRLVESRADGYRNLELASRYLRRSSAQSLRAALLYHAAQFCNWDALSDFARHGTQTGFLSRNAELREQAAECVAAITAAEVVNCLGAPPAGPLLVVGWGYAAYREAIAQRWPELVVHGWNPFSYEHAGVTGTEYGTVILSGVLEWCGTAEMRTILGQIEFKLDGVLLCQDSLFPVGAQPSPEVALSALARQVADGAAHTWSMERLAAALQRSGFAVPDSARILGKGVLVLARRQTTGSPGTEFAAAAAD
jgi:hypothetical protein